MEWYDLLIIIHVIGVAMGVGGATVSDFLFFKTLRKGVIDKASFEFMELISKVMWGGLGLLVFSGFGLFLLIRILVPQTGFLYEPRILAHFSVFLILLLNGLLMHAKVFTFFERNIGKAFSSEEFKKKAYIMFSTGAVSIVSWYTALVLGLYRSSEASYFQFMGTYLVILIGAVIISNVVGRKFTRRREGV